MRRRLSQRTDRLVAVVEQRTGRPVKAKGKTCPLLTRRVLRSGKLRSIWRATSVAKRSRRSSLGYPSRPRPKLPAVPVSERTRQRRRQLPRRQNALRALYCLRQHQPAVAATLRAASASVHPRPRPEPATIPSRASPCPTCPYPLRAKLPSSENRRRSCMPLLTPRPRQLTRTWLTGLTRATVPGEGRITRLRLSPRFSSRQTLSSGWRLSAGGGLRKERRRTLRRPNHQTLPARTRPMLHRHQRRNLRRQSTQPQKRERAKR